MKRKKFILSAASALLLVACDGGSSSVKSTTTSSALPGKDSGKNQLSMKINGTPWVADNNFFGAFHPVGYNKAILIAGSKGPKDKNEQAFNLNLYNTVGPGTYIIEAGNADQSVVQLANLSPENFLYGSMMGFKLKVNIIRASSNPTVVEATFEGEMGGNASDKLTVTEGKFYYSE